MSEERTAVATAFDDWVHARLSHLTRFARTLTADEHAAHDLVQDTLERTLVHWSRIQDPDAWVRRAMVNRSISVWRKLGRERPTETLPDRAVDDAIRDVVLFDALKTLAPRQRAVIALRYLEDLTETQTAEIMGCSVGTVKSQASAAIRNLRERIGDAEVDTPAVLEQVHAGAEARRRRRTAVAVSAAGLALVILAAGLAWAARHPAAAPIQPVDSPAPTASTLLGPVSGPGLTITLTDAPRSVIAAASSDVNLMVVHQQDVQAVLDALWHGGARAVTLQGQRVTRSTTVTLRGANLVLGAVSYPEPFVVRAVGSQRSLLAALAADPEVRLYRAQSRDPSIRIGWRLVRSAQLTVPGS